MKIKLPERIDTILNGRPMKYYDLAQALFPSGKSWNYQSNGGPPGCYMALSAALSRGGFQTSLEFGAGNRTVYPRKQAIVKEENNVVVA